ncbi:hypothetical protein [Wolbachia pipientis]|uniref:hypothetical protein n=1 Tax=Wolbachia pipientis TaxID=955 RepID=UPI0020B68854|nr:hypothetical protein [Wolbachia pipientis]
MQLFDRIQLMVHQIQTTMKKNPPKNDPIKEKGLISIPNKLLKKELGCSSFVDDSLRGLTPFCVSVMSIECPLSAASIFTSLSSSALISCCSSFGSCSCVTGWTLPSCPASFS